MSCEDSVERVELLKYQVPYQLNVPPDEKPIFQFGTDKPYESDECLTTPNLPGITVIQPGPHDSGLSRGDIKEILNAILPPLEWTDADGRIWRKEISSTPATRNDVTALHQNLLIALKQRQAREKGICPIRQELYAEVFDELIRQVTINNAECGLLLLRVRNEIRMTLAAHMRLFENGFAYGTRKANLVTESDLEYRERYEDLVKDKTNLEYQVQELTIEIDQADRKNSETREVTEKKNMEEIQFLKRANQQLRFLLEGIQGIKKS